MNGSNGLPGGTRRVIADVRFVDGTAYALGHDEGVPWEEIVRTAYFQRVQLFAAGYYRTAGSALGLRDDEGLAVQVLRLRLCGDRGRG